LYKKDPNPNFANEHTKHIIRAEINTPTPTNIRITSIDQIANANTIYFLKKETNKTIEE